MADKEHEPDLRDSDIAGLKHQADTDRDTIAGMQHQADTDRGTIAGMQHQADTDRETIAGLEVQSEIDRALIRQLEADGLVDRDRIENLDFALVAARRIGAAMGVLMQAGKITEAEAFAALRTASQSQHRKLRDVAEAVLLTGSVDEVS